MNREMMSEAKDGSSITLAAAIAELHHWYCSRTQLKTKLCFSERLWFDRLRDYDYDPERLRSDCELIVRYLKKEIAVRSRTGTGRNVGALKLSNFLQPDLFDENLALARLSSRKSEKPKRGNAEIPERRLSEVELNEIERKARAGAEHLRKLRQSMSGK